jgi:hypothetical protein
MVSLYIPNKANTVELVDAILGHFSSIGSLGVNPLSKNRMIMRYKAITIFMLVLLKQIL